MHISQLVPKIRIQNVNFRLLQFFVHLAEQGQIRRQRQHIFRENIT